MGTRGFDGSQGEKAPSRQNPQRLTSTADFVATHCWKRSAYRVTIGVGLGGPCTATRGPPWRRTHGTHKPSSRSRAHPLGIEVHGDATLSAVTTLSHHPGRGPTVHNSESGPYD